MHLKATLLKWLKLFFDYILQAIVGYIVVGLILAGGGVYLLTKIGLNWVIQIANTATPLWATILLMLLCYLYIYVKDAKILSKSKQVDQASKAPPYETKYFVIGNYKWETKIYKNNYFEVDKYPYCIKHDLRFIFGNHRKYCPGSENQKCNNGLSEYDEFTVYESAKSIIESKIRNKKY